MIFTKIFGNLPDTTPVSCYTIQNNAGEFVELLDFGAAIHGIHVRDFNAEIGNVIVNIKEAKDLANDQGGQSVHWGIGNCTLRFFHAEVDESTQSVCFSLHDAGNGGLDCAVDAQVRFSFDDDHRLEITCELDTEGDTMPYPMNHAFFNLAGSGDVLNHKLRIYASQFAPNGENGMPVSEIRSVRGLPVDFSKRRTLREAMRSDPTGYFQHQPAYYNEYFLLSKKGFGEAAELLSPETGRMMRVYTDMPALNLFTPPNELSSGYGTVCLKAQFVPNAVNCPQDDSPLFRKGNKLRSRTVYEFVPLFELRQI